MIDPTGMAADTTGGVMGPIVDIWRSVTTTFTGVMTMPKTTFEFPKFRPTPPPNPFILAAGLFLLPSNYFDPKRPTDEMEWYRNNRHLLAKKHKLGGKLSTPELNKDKFNKKRGNQGWENKETGEICQKSHTSHGNKNNEGTQWKVWPNEISIEDGQFMENGVLFKNLSNVWDAVEQKTNDLDEWMSLMTWVLFSEFHNQAILNYKNGLYYVHKDNINKENVKKRLLENLKAPDYLDMYEEFIKDNKI